ncbi:MAG: hypothetical protein M3R41_06660, partial [Pseudomonadota bacterium]|nr:hypothetical protein [Pseudomonadota bacterium]
MRTGYRAALGAAAVIVGATAGAPAQAPRVQVLAQIEPGEWQLRVPGSTAPVREMCVADPATLLQLGHPGAACHHLVLADDPAAATVHYDCPGHGHGRTVLSVETPRLL